MSSTTTASELVAQHPYAEGFVDREVRDVMTPGVVVIDENASVERAARALAAHRVHAILVLAHDGEPLGWVTVRGLLGWLDRDRSLATARDAITEQVTGIEPSATVRAALYALALPGVTRLAVRRRGGGLPEGVVTDFDLAMPAGR